MLMLLPAVMVRVPEVVDGCSLLVVGEFFIVEILAARLVKSWVAVMEMFLAVMEAVSISVEEIFPELVGEDPNLSW